jgi:hypothetical protein
LALVAKALGTLRILGRGAKVAEEAVRLERVLAALARIAESSRLERIAELLPESHLADLERIARAVDLPVGADVGALRAALKLRNEEALLGAVDELADAMAVAGTVESRLGPDAARYAPGLRHLMRSSQLNRAALIDLLEKVPGEQLGEFLHATTFAGPQHLRAWGAAGLRGLAERPRALAFLREAGGDVVDAVGRRTGVWGSGGVPTNVWDRTRGSTHGWDDFNHFLDGLEKSRTDPQSYQRLLSRLREGDAASFAQVEYAERAERVARRLQQGGHRRLRSLLDEYAAKSDPALHAGLVNDLIELSDRELAGLEQLVRWEPNEVLLSDILGLADRENFLGLVADVGPHTQSGLDNVLRSIFGVRVQEAGAMQTKVQGSWGQLYAGRTLLGQPHNARGLRFEWAAVRREYDIVADVAGGELHAEVKTNLPNLEGKVRASKDAEQMAKDLVNHAGTGYTDLLYLYHPNLAGNLPGVRARMLRLFDEPEVQSALRARGLDPSAARRAFEQRMGTLVTAYRL